MIIWLSGPYGVGKSTLAEALASRMGGALIFDAEEVGNAVRDNYPDHPYGYVLDWFETHVEPLGDFETFIVDKAAKAEADTSAAA